MQPGAHAAIILEKRQQTGGAAGIPSPEQVAHQGGLVVGFIEAIVDIIYGSRNQLLVQAFRDSGVNHDQARIDNSRKITNAAAQLGLSPNVVSAGVGLNSMHIWRQLGQRARVLTSLGPDNEGKIYETQLREAGIELRAEKSQGTTNTVYVALDTNKDRLMAFCEGSCNNDLTVDLITDDRCKTAAYFLLESFILFKDHAIADEICRRAREGNRPLILLAGAAGVLRKDRVGEKTREILSSETPVIFFANDAECNALGGVDAISNLLKKNPYRNMAKAVVTDGGGNVRVITKDEIKTIDLGEKLDSANVVSTLGAGDAFAGAFMFAQHKGLSDVDSVKFAHIFASAVVQQDGAKLPDEKVQELLSSSNLKGTINSEHQVG